MAIFSELWKVDLGPFGNKLFIWCPTRVISEKQYINGHNTTRSYKYTSIDILDNLRISHNASGMEAKIRVLVT